MHRRRFERKEMCEGPSFQDMRGISPFRAKLVGSIITHYREARENGLERERLNRRKKGLKLCGQESEDSENHKDVHEIKKGRLLCSFSPLSFSIAISITPNSFARTHTHSAHTPGWISSRSWRTRCAAPGQAAQCCGPCQALLFH